MVHLWFKAKHYGWGWSPSSWEGWLVTLVYLVFLFGDFVRIDRASSSVSDALSVFIPHALILTLILLIICYWKGERPSWRWGTR